jgi:hypothetical protein
VACKLVVATYFALAVAVFLVRLQKSTYNPTNTQHHWGMLLRGLTHESEGTVSAKAGYQYSLVHHEGWMMVSDHEKQFSVGFQFPS